MTVRKSWTHRARLQAKRPPCEKGDKTMNWMQKIAHWFGRATKSLGSLGIGVRAALGGAAPGGWASDHREETSHNTGFNYIAVHAIASQVAGATVTVFADGHQQPQRQVRRKALAARSGTFVRWKSIYGADDRETDSLPAAHPLVRLLKRPNPFESGANFRYRQAQQIRLTGSCLIWNVPSVAGPTCERYVIPTAMASPVAPTIELPQGGWRISPVASRYTPIVDDSFVDCPSWYRILGQVVDARQIQVIRLPHAWYLDDGQSPLSAGAKWVDAGDAVDAARFHQLRNGIDPSIVLESSSRCFPRSGRNRSCAGKNQRQIRWSAKCRTRDDCPEWHHDYAAEHQS